MRIDRLSMGALISTVVLASALRAQDPLVPFQDSDRGTWGYRRADGTVVVPARYVGAGVFRNGYAPVQDSAGFAIIDETGQVADRIGIDSVSPSAKSVAPPAADCAWSGSGPFPSAGLLCYLRQLRGDAPAVGGEITIRSGRGESSRSVVVMRFANGVVAIENIGYEGFTRRVLLPASVEQVVEWQRRLYPDLPPKGGCSESWSTGSIPGGAFIEQVVGC